MKNTLNLLVLVCLLSLFTACTADNGGLPHPSQELENFVGTWLNENESTGHITKVAISSFGNSLFIKVWGKCSPEDCEWEIRRVKKNDILGGVIKVSWEEMGFLYDTFLEIEFSDDLHELLKITSLNIPNEPGHKEYTTIEYFNKL